MYFAYLIVDHPLVPPVCVTGFQAINLDVGFLNANGPQAVKECLDAHNLLPGCYRC